MTTAITGPVRLLPGDVSEDVWLAERRNGIGASDVAAVLGLSKWAGPLTVYASKVHGYEQPVTDAMEIGRTLEPWVMSKFSRQHPELHVTAKPGTFRAADAPWRMVTPDGNAATGLDVPPTVLVEAKTARTFGDDAEEGWGTPGTDEVPYPYLVQVTWSCALLGYTHWHIPVLFDGHEYTEYRGSYSPALGEQLFTRIDQWWHQYVVARVEPPADGLAATTRLLAGYHRAPARSVGQLPADALLWRETYNALSQEMKELKGQRDEVGNYLRQAHNAAGVEVGMVGTEKVSTFSRIATGSVRLDVKGTRK